MAVTATPPRRRRPEIRPEQILDAAERVLAGRGLAATTMAAVASEAGLSKGAVYLYFRSKRDLLSAVRARYLQRFADALGTRGGGGAADELHQFVLGLFEFSAAHRELHHALFHEAGVSEMDTLTTATAAFSALVHRGTASGTFEVADLDLTVSFLLHGLHGALLGALHSSVTGVAAVAADVELLMARALGLRRPATS